MNSMSLYTEDHIDSILKQAIQYKKITQTRANELYKELNSFIQELVLYYNHDASTSLSSEEFQQILDTIDYVFIHGYHWEDLNKNRIRDIFYKGWENLLKDTIKIHQLYNKVSKEILPFKNDRYLSIIQEQIPAILKTLNSDCCLFHYCQIQEDLDYPLFDGYAFDHDMYCCKGTDLVLYYLNRFSIEQTFCFSFYKDIPELLSRFEIQKGIKTEELGLNLFEIVLCQDIAHMICFSKPGILLEKKDVDFVYHFLEKRNINKVIKETLKQIGQSFHKDIQKYLFLFQETILHSFEDFIMNHKEILVYPLIIENQSFLSFPAQINQKEFKKLLKDMQSMNINQKIQYLKTETINVYDILDLLDHNIFYEDEYLCYFNALKSFEIAILLKTLYTPDSSFHIKIKLEDIYEYLDTTIDWQKEMIHYLKNCSMDRKKEIEKYINRIQI